MPKTIHEYTLETVIASNDEIVFWDVSVNGNKRITKQNFLGAILTGGGTIVTGGHTATFPGTGTVAMRGLANTFSALATFGAGINLGQSDNLGHYDLAVWTPNVRDNVDPGAGVAASVGTTFATYIRIGDIVVLFCTLTNITTTGMTAGNTVHIHGLPFASKSNQLCIAACRVQDIAFAQTPVAVLGASISYITLAESLSGGTAVPIIVSDLETGLADISFTMIYGCVAS